MDRDDTLPPSSTEQDALATFEQMIRSFGELDARYVHTTTRLDSLMSAQPEDL